MIQIEDCDFFYRFLPNVNLAKIKVGRFETDPRRWVGVSLLHLGVWHFERIGYCRFKGEFGRINRKVCIKYPLIWWPLPKVDIDFFSEVESNCLVPFPLLKIWLFSVSNMGLINQGIMMLFMGWKQRTFRSFGQELIKYIQRLLWLPIGPIRIHWYSVALVTITTRWLS